MVRHFYLWILPVVLFGIVVVMTIPYLAVVFVAAVVLAVVAALGADASPRVALHSGGLGGGETR